MATTIETYLGSGFVSVRPYASRAPFEFVGNCSNLSLAIDEDEKTMQDYTQPGGGKYDSVRRVTAVSLNMTWLELSVSNLMRVLYAQSRFLPAAAVTDETVLLTPGRRTLFERMPLTVSAVTVDGTALAEDAYTVTGGGIMIPDDSDIAPDTEAVVNYAAAGVDIIEALTQSGQYWELAFEGLNEAGTGKRTNIRVHRVKIGAAQDLGFISDDFASLEVTGDALKDSRQTLPGRSAYFRIEKERAVA